jgi:hypothetical protein
MLHVLGILDIREIVEGILFSKTAPFLEPTPGEEIERTIVLIDPSELKLALVCKKWYEESWNKKRIFNEFYRRTKEHIHEKYKEQAHLHYRKTYQLRYADKKLYFLSAGEREDKRSEFLCVSTFCHRHQPNPKEHYRFVVELSYRQSFEHMMNQPLRYVDPKSIKNCPMTYEEPLVCRTSPEDRTEEQREEAHVWLEGVLCAFEKEMLLCNESVKKI